MELSIPVLYMQLKSINRNYERVNITVLDGRSVNLLVKLDDKGNQFEAILNFPGGFPQVAPEVTTTMSRCIGLTMEEFWAWRDFVCSQFSAYGRFDSGLNQVDVQAKAFREDELLSGMCLLPPVPSTAGLQECYVCKTRLHKPCFKQWVKSHLPECPVCKQFMMYPPC